MSRLYQWTLPGRMQLMRRLQLENSRCCLPRWISKSNSYCRLFVKFHRQRVFGRIFRKVVSCLRFDRKPRKFSFQFRQNHIENCHCCYRLWFDFWSTCFSCEDLLSLEVNTLPFNVLKIDWRSRILFAVGYRNDMIIFFEEWINFFNHIVVRSESLV